MKTSHHNALLLSSLFLLSIAATFLAAAFARLFDRWTCDFSALPLTVLLPFLVGLALCGFCIRKKAAFPGLRTLLGLWFVVAILAFFPLYNTQSLATRWVEFSLSRDLTYGSWTLFVLKQAVLWLTPTAFLIPLTWGQVRTLPRARMTVFCGACVGVILARIFLERMPTAALLKGAHLTLLLAVTLGAVTLGKTLWSRIFFAALPAVGLLLAIFGTHPAKQELLREVNPFAIIAARDTMYTGIGTDAPFVLKKGRVLYNQELDRASRVAAQLIPLFFKPTATARIAAFPQDDAPLFVEKTEEELKGLYDALYWELPPAWDASEGAVFSSGFLKSVKERLTPNGVLVYDLDGRALDLNMLRERIAALHVVFPHIQLWMTGLNDWQLVASPEPLTITFAALDGLSDRPEVLAQLAQTRMLSPLFVLPSCMLSDAITLGPKDKDAPRTLGFAASTRHARSLLFDGRYGKRLTDEFKTRYAVEPEGIVIPEALQKDVGDVLLTLRNARRMALNEEYLPASKINDSDPYTLGLADHTLREAYDYLRLKNNQRALQAFTAAFFLAKPRVEDLLVAGRLAYTSGHQEEAETFYLTAEGIAPDTFDVAKEFGIFLLETKAYAAARERFVRAEALAESDEDKVLARWFQACCMVNLPETALEGLELARTIAEQAKTPKAKEAYIPTYGQFLVDNGYLVEGVKVKRHYAETGELLSIELTPRKHHEQ